MTNEDDARLDAIIAESMRNQRDNPAVRDQYLPEQFTPAMERELVETLYGTEAERIDRLITEHNESQRKR